MKRLCVMDEQWDHLIVLDACRYDYFQDAYERYLTGDLSKRTSLASTTAQWLRRSFKGYYDDVIYISTNPYMNSVKRIRGYLGSEHFFKVVDLWKDGWDASKGTVLPETVTGSATEMLQSHPHKRLIVHYLQPHEPYLGLDSPGFPAPDVHTGNVLMNTNDPNRKPNPRRSILKKLKPLIMKTRFLINQPLWKFNELLMLEPMNPMDAVRRRYGVEELKRHYRKNLDIVLKEVTVLLEHLCGRIAITADHGEFLGEGGNFGHQPFSQDPILLTVPWLVIEKEASSVTAEPRSKKELKEESTDERIVLDRLRDLGYFEL